VVDLSGYPDLEYVSSIETSRRHGVFRAISKKYGLCVVKATSQTATQVDVQQLRREYLKLRLCVCENIVPVYDIYDHQSSLGVALVTTDCGSSLKAWVQRQLEKPSLETVVNIGIQIAQGLDQLHRHARLIHGDITPNNVCYCEKTKRAVIIDLGGAHGFSEPGTALYVSRMRMMKECVSY
jgi:serine/threonine protein kinase